MNSFRLWLIALLCLAPLPAGAQEAGVMPSYLQDLDKAYSAGDWVLQCDSSRICRIVGVVKQSGRGTDMRAIVTISRGIEKNARYYVRFAFIDDNGFVLPPPGETARLYALGRPKMPPPLPLHLGAAEGDALYPHYRVGSEHGWRIVSALQRWPGVVLRNRGTLLSRMPRGDLDQLLRRMDTMQEPLSSKISALQEAEWMQEYNHIVVRARPAPRLPLPADIGQSCAKRDGVTSHEAWEVDRTHRLWIIHCARGAHMFMQEARPGAAGEYGTPVPFDIRPRGGGIRVADDAHFLPERSVLQLTLARRGRWDCGARMQYGFTTKGGFGVIEDRRMPLCRGIPPAYWPMAWAPTSWKYED